MKKILHTGPGPAATGTSGQAAGDISAERDNDRLNLGDIRNTVPSAYFAALEDFFSQE